MITAPLLHHSRHDPVRFQRRLRWQASWTLLSRGRLGLKRLNPVGLRGVRYRGASCSATDSGALRSPCHTHWRQFGATKVLFCHLCRVDLLGGPVAPVGGALQSDQAFHGRWPGSRNARSPARRQVVELEGNRCVFSACSFFMMPRRWTLPRLSQF